MNLDLNEWFFMLTTIMISSKLIVSFWLAVKSNPGYLEPGEGKQFKFKELVKIVPTDKLCPECKIIKTNRSKHCTVSNRCVDRYEGYCVWLNNCIGRNNSNMYMVFIFYVWLDTFFLGWIAMSSIPVTSCNTEHYGTPCVYRSLCWGCTNLFIHYVVTVGDMIICFFFMVPTTWYTIMQFVNYGRNETTNERFVKAERIQSNSSELESTSSLYSSISNVEDDGALLSGGERVGRGHKRKGCW